MADISSITLPNGTTYNIKDATARKGQSVYYATCSTAAGTAAKVATTTNGDFELTTGAVVIVKFTNGQTYNGAATLNVDGKGAKTIVRVGTTNTTRYFWQGGEAITFVYDGTYFVMTRTGQATTTYFGITQLSSSTSSTSEVLAATPKAVKEAYDLAASKGSGTVTSISTGAGLTGGDITSSGTIKADLKSETKSSLTAASKGSTSGREYAVGLDANGDLSVNVPWENTQTVTGVKGSSESSYRTGNVSISASNIGLGNVENKSSATIRGELTKSNVTTALGFTPYTQDEVNALVSSVFTYKGTKSTYAQVSALTGMKTGDVWQVTADNSEYVYNGTAWEKLGPTIDLSGYLTSVSVAGQSLTPSANSITAAQLKTALGLGTAAYVDTESTVANDSKLPTGAAVYNHTANRTFFGTCSTAAATSEKVITLVDADDFKLVPGVMIAVKYTVSNTASNCTLNVNGTGGKQVWWATAAYTGSSKELLGYANRFVYYVYDGTYWAFVNHSGNGNDNVNTVPAAQCETAAGTAAKVATCTNYTLTANTYLHFNIRYTNTAKSALTMNVNSKGAKPIYINGAASSSSNYTLPAGTYIAFYNGTNWYFRTDGVLPAKVEMPKVTQSANTTHPTNSYVIEQYTSGDSYNLPTNHEYAITTATSDKQNYSAQLAMGLNTNGLYYRRSFTGGWDDWANILKPGILKVDDVDQSADTDTSGIYNQFFVKRHVAGENYNLPDNNLSYMILSATGPGGGVQIAFGYNTKGAYYRRWATSGWTEWYDLLTPSLLSISHGGTNATTAADARTNLGLGSVSTFDTVPIDNGGTGATSAANARTNLGLGSASTTDLASTTKSSLSSTAMGTTANRQYAVGLDKDGYLSVNVPWTDTAVKSVSYTGTTASGGYIQGALSVFGITDGTAILQVYLQKDSYSNTRSVDISTYGSAGYRLTFYDSGSVIASKSVTCTIYYI